MNTHPTASPSHTIKAIDRLASPCALCTLRCHAKRADEERGRCGVDHRTHLYSLGLSFGEELHLSPSYLISFTGCTLACAFCSERAHLKPPFSPPFVKAEDLVQYLLVQVRKNPKIHNFNFVGGEPTPHLPFIARVAQGIKGALERPPKLLFNSNGLITPEALRLALTFLDLWVIDLKFGNDPCAKAIAGHHPYLEPLRQSLRTIHQQSPDALTIRHLLMPGHLECCTKPTLDWVAQNLPHATLNIMDHFVDFSASKRWGILRDEARKKTKDWLSALDGLQVLWNGGPLVA